MAAGIAASFFKMVTAEPARFALLGRGWLATTATFLFCAVTGPAIVIDLVLKQRPLGGEGLSTLFAGVVVAMLWSVCSGMLVLDLVLQLRDTLA